MRVSYSLLLIQFFLILSLQSYSQKDYNEGFIITNSSDTLFGLVKDRKSPPFGKLYSKIRFKSSNTFPRKYGPDKVIGYSTGDSYFESIWIDRSANLFTESYYSLPGIGSKQFLKVIVKGYLTYYLMEHEDPESGSIDYVPFFKKKDEPALIRVTQGIFGLKRKNLSAFFYDCPELVYKIDSKELVDPMDIALYYNAFIAGLK